LGGEKINRENRTKIYFVRKNKLIRTTTFTATLLIAAILLFSSVVPAAINNNTQMNTIVKKAGDIKKDINNEEASSTGLAPDAKIPSVSRAPIKEPINGGNNPLGRGTTMYGYVAYSSAMSNGPCYWDVEDPATVTKLSDETVGLLSGGAWTCDEKWYVCELYSGLIYTVTTDTGHIELVGGGGNTLNALAYDKLTNTMWAAGDYDLFSIDMETGAQTVVGPFGSTYYIIGMAFDSNGVLYGWDIIQNYLWTIDTTTGAATQVGPLGIDLNYAQDGAIDHTNGDILYLAAFTLSPSYGGYEYTVDLETGTATYVGAFPGTSEIDACMFQNPCIPPEHDLGIKSIDQPQDGPAYAPVTMQVTVKNYGNHSETTDVQYEIIKCEEGPALFAEDFTYGIPYDWTYSGYSLSYTNLAGGISPEVFYGYTSYVSNGYIMTPPIDVTGYEKVNVKFHLYGDFYGYSGTFFYLQYRKNASSPWRDVSPWENPITEDLGPEAYEIGCYGWGEPIGEAFQARWYFGSYYWYLQYGSGIYLDDAQFFGCAGCAEYNNLAEDVEVPYDGQVIVDEFAQWTPSEWQNPDFQNTWEDYPITTYTTLEDNNMQNNKKIKLLHLYYPWLHNVGTISTEGPQSGPAQTFPVKATVKNTGQFPECCFKAYAEIMEFGGGGGQQLLTQYFDSSYPWPPTGWTDTYPSNWQCWYSNYAGGSPYELVFVYYPSQTATARFISPAIDTTGFGSVEINFKHYINHYSGPYTLKVETSQDKISWSTVWEIVNPSSSGGGDISITTSDNVGGTTYVSWTFEGNFYNINYWFVDNIVINGYAVTTPEYSNFLCISSIDPGQEIELTFPNWTPAYLAEGTTATKKYSFKVYTDLQVPPDNDVANDAIAKTIKLDFFHDVAVEVTSPIPDRGEVFYAVDTSQYPSNSRFIWFDPTIPGVFHDIGKWPNSNFPQGATFDNKGVEWVCDTTGNIWKVDAPTGAYTFVGNAGTGELVGLAFHEKSKIMYGASSNNLYTINMATGKATLVGPFQQLGYYMIDIENDRDGTMYGYDLNYDQSRTYRIDLTTGHATAIGLCGVSLMYGQDMAYDWATKKMYACAFNVNTYQGELHEINLQTGKFTYLGTLQNGAQTTCFAIPGGGMDTFVPLGTQSIEGIGSNLGTFSELGMTCYADIYEYITNCEEGTLVQSYSIYPVDIPTPLTGTIPLVFGNYDFAIEGLYKLVLNLENDNDDNPNNNIVEWGIGADGTAPTSTHKLSPAAPDGDNGWYVSDITVTLSATDPGIGCDTDGSGPREIKYTINGVPGSVPGDTGTFKIENDGTNIEVKYWSIDNVGNEEAKHTFYINMDQTKPEIPESITYSSEKIGTYWYITFNVTCTDATSLMDRVEWATNDVVQNITTGPGPNYNWTIQWSDVVDPPTFKAIAYDKAGNSDFVTINGSDIKSHPRSQSVNTHLSSNMLFWEVLRIPILQKLLVWMVSWVV
jgi:hypothetical protein